jgi:hypothetical protein
VDDIIVLLTEALKGIGAADNKLIQAHTKADHHNPSRPRRRLIAQCLTSRSLSKGRLRCHYVMASPPLM